MPKNDKPDYELPSKRLKKDLKEKRHDSATHNKRLINKLELKQKNETIKPPNDKKLALERSTTAPRATRRQSPKVFEKDKEGRSIRESSRFKVSRTARMRRELQKDS